MTTRRRTRAANSLGLHWVLFALAITLSLVLIGANDWSTSARSHDGVAIDAAPTDGATRDRLVVFAGSGADTVRALDIIGAQQIRAVFVVNGPQAAGDPDAIRQIADAGHDIAIGAPREANWGSALDIRLTRLTIAAAMDRTVATVRLAEPTRLTEDGTAQDAARTLSSIGVTARILSVPETVGAPAPPASVLASAGGMSVAAMVLVGHHYAGVVQLLMLVFGVLCLIRIGVLLAAVARARRRSTKYTPEYTGGTVTVLVPAYNEAVCIEATVRSALSSNTPVRVIVIDDGSTDGTADIVEALDLPDVTVLRQPNSGKSAALNYGLRKTTTEFVVMVDGDTVLEPGTVRAMVGHFSDPDIAAVSGNVKVGNRVGILGRWQHIEYVIGFNFDRTVYDVMGAHPTIPGAVGAFRCLAMTAMGGMPLDTLAEDTDLPMALQRAGWTVVYEPAARAWTEVPLTTRQLWRQRFRWSFGILQAAWKHRRAIGERGSSTRLGGFVLPYLLTFQYAMPLFGPFIGVAVMYGLVDGQWSTASTLWSVAWVAQVIPAVLAFRLDGERLRPLITLPFQQAFYQLLTSLLVFHTMIAALAGIELPWHKLDRTGLTTDRRPDAETAHR